MRTTLTYVDAVDILSRHFGPDRGHALATQAVFMPIGFKREGIKYVVSGVPGQLDDLFYLTSGKA